MKQRHTALLLAAIMVLSLLVPLVQAQEVTTDPEFMAVYYVSPNGNDNNDGTTIQTPFATVK